MKVEVSTKEFMSLINKSEMANIKAKVAGMILATVDSEEIQDAIEKRVTRKAEERMEKILGEAVRNQAGWNRNQILGWGADIIRDEFEKQMSGVSFEQILRGIVAEETKRQLDNGIQDMIKTEVRHLIKEDLLETYTSYIKHVDFRELVQHEVKRRFNKVLT
ncbi:hypothetical protein P8918_12920 [Bacillus spizizenii]|nr:hypothetical protein [Bacillus spizizenii]MCY8890472.1 hypothetical protein [Bacillus spizizenii]MEC0841927.1 hypothetical protein [Bacillus spizizenii]